MKKTLLLSFALLSVFLFTDVVKAETILFEDFEDTDGYTIGGGPAGYWDIASLSGTPLVPSHFITGGNQSGNIFYGSRGKSSEPAPTMTIALPELSEYENLKVTVSLAAPDGTLSTNWEINHRDKLEITGDGELIDLFLPISGKSALWSTVSDRSLHYDFQNHEYIIDASLSSLTFTFASTADDEVIGIDSLILSGNRILSNKDQCKKDGWKLFSHLGFENQGMCVSYLERNPNAIEKE